MAGSLSGCWDAKSGGNIGALIAPNPTESNQSEDEHDDEDESRWVKTETHRAEPRLGTDACATTALNPTGSNQSAGQTASGKYIEKANEFEKIKVNQGRSR